MSDHEARGLGGAPRVVLIVVDRPAHRTLLRRAFEASPHHLVFAADGEDGFDRYGESKPHLVMADIDVNRLDGTILCQLIRQQPGGNEVPVVLIGEDLGDDEASRHRVAAVGADAQLGLPCTPEQLAEVLAPLLEEGRRTAVVPENIQERPPVVIGAPGQPTELTFGSMLEDFMSQTDEAGPEPENEEESPTENRSLDALVPPPENAEAPLPRPNTPRGQDMDTVVSFQNPFFEGDPPTSLELPSAPPVVASAPPPSPAGVAVIQPPLGQDEPPTPVGAAPEPPAEPLMRDSAPRISSSLGGEAPITELAETPSPPMGVSLPPPSPPPSPLMGVPVPDARPIAETPAPVAAEAPLAQGPVEIPPTRPDPLEEPRISGTGVGVRPRPEGSGKSRLIREVPREITPSDENRVSQVQAPKRAAGPRRGLDESQLGKRLAKRVRTMHRLLDEVDYYQLLGVERSASSDDLRRAYFDLSLEFHPDRFFLLRSGDLKEKIYDIYRRIAEAYRVLSDERKRRAYDEARSLSSVKRAAPELRGESDANYAPVVPTAPAGGGGFTAVGGSDAGMRFVDIARAAFDRGDLNAARLHLVLARAHEGDNASLRETLDMVAREQFAAR